MPSRESRRELIKSQFGLHKLLPQQDLMSDQQKGAGAPPLQKPFVEDAEIIQLPEPDAAVLTERDINACVSQRRSRRQFAAEDIPLENLSYLLWATQGIQEVVGDGYASFRTVPSGGARHPLETYVVANRVSGLAKGVFRYLPCGHRLLFEFDGEDVSAQLAEAACGQAFVGEAPVTFIWTCVPYRCEWRYPLEAPKLILLDAGHACQNLYLACEAMGYATCAIAAYEQDAMDRLLRVDGENEFAVYLAPAGKK